MTHKTKGIVLRSVKYGETSVVVTIYTELFGIQSYMVKGVRKSSKTSSGKAIYFQPSAILDMVVYHNPLKNLNFIKELGTDQDIRVVFIEIQGKPIVAHQKIIESSRPLARTWPSQKPMKKNFQMIQKTK